MTPAYQLAANKRYRLAHPQKNRAYVKKYAAAHPEKAKEWQDKATAKYRAKLKAQGLNWYRVKKLRLIAELLRLKGYGG